MATEQSNALWVTQNSSPLPGSWSIGMSWTDSLFIAKLGMAEMKQHRQTS